MHKAPLVSVFIPSFNHANYIDKTIASVIGQTYSQIELIVIDDGSTDNSIDVIGPLAQKHGFHFESQKNIGLAKTLNRGLDIAQGKYFCMIGSDDIMLADKTEKQVAFMEDNPEVTVTFGNTLDIDSQGKLLKVRREFIPQRDVTFDEMFFGKMPPASSAMSKLSVLKKEGGYDPSIPLEDTYMWLKLSSRGYQLVHLNDVLIYYRKHDDNTYKNIAYMMDNKLKTYALHSDNPQYEAAVNNLFNTLIGAASKQDAKLTWHIFRRISPKYYNMKTLRGLLRILQCKTPKTR